jgi:DNA-binding transcriptional regulator YiaG
MQPEELRDRITKLDLSQNDASRLLGVDPRTMRRWLSGEKSVAAPVIILLKMMEAVPGAADWLKANPHLLD